MLQFPPFYQPSTRPPKLRIPFQPHPLGWMRWALEGIVIDMSWHVVTTCHLLPISGQHGWHANLVTEWVAGVTYHKLLCVVYDTTRWCSLLSVFVACCDTTKKDVDVTWHLSCRRHVTKCHMLLTLSPSISLRWQTTIPTKRWAEKSNAYCCKKFISIHMQECI